jgi:hypothetical protein
MIVSYADLLVTQLRKVADGVQVQDMSHWFEWTVSLILVVSRVPLRLFLLTTGLIRRSILEASSLSASRSSVWKVDPRIFS